MQRRCPVCQTGTLHMRHWISAGELLIRINHAGPQYPEISASDIDCYAAATRASRQQSSARGDRKSTRLNSSHLVISYAVFCLNHQNARLFFSALVRAVFAHCVERNLVTHD